jgi:hypothetical protein
MDLLRAEADIGKAKNSRKSIEGKEKELVIDEK